MRITFYGTLLASVVVLSGCATLERMFSSYPPIPGCESQIVTTAADVSLTGFKLPIGATKNIDIAGITYTPKQLQVLTESVMQIDQYKMGQCGVLEIARRSTPPPSLAQLQPLLSEVLKLNKQILDIAAAVRAGTPPEKITAAIGKAAEQLPTTPTPIPVADNGLGSPLLPTADIFNKLVSIETSIKQISVPKTELSGEGVTFRGADNGVGSSVPPATDIGDRLASIEASIKKLSVTKTELDERRIIVRGYAPNAIALNANMRARFLSELGHLNTEGPGKRVVFDVVGYADSSGTYANNVKLGLDRARLVAEIVSLHVRPTPIVRVTSSAGVAEAGTDGRRVEVFYTAYTAGGLQGT